MMPAPMTIPAYFSDEGIVDILVNLTSIKAPEQWLDTCYPNIDDCWGHKWGPEIVDVARMLLQVCDIDHLFEELRTKGSEAGQVFKQCMKLSDKCLNEKYRDWLRVVHLARCHRGWIAGEVCYPCPDDCHGYGWGDKVLEAARTLAKACPPERFDAELRARDSFLRQLFNSYCNMVLDRKEQLRALHMVRSHRDWLSMS